MKTITIYAIMQGNDIVSTTHKQEQAIETCQLLNEANKTDSYHVVACNGLIIETN